MTSLEPRSPVAGWGSDVGGDFIPTSEKGAANGVASLDSGTKVPVAQVPDLSDTYIPLSQKGASNGVAALSGSVLPRSYYQYANTTQDGSIVLAGDLAGTATLPRIANALKDPAAATAGLRTLGTGAQQAAAGTAPAAAVTAHEQAADPHPQYLTAAEGNAAYQAAGSYQAADSDLSAIAALAPADGAVLRRIAGAWSSSTIAEIKTALALAKADVGLGSVDNTSDAAKPVSTATQTALDSKADRALSVRTVTASGSVVDTDNVILADTTSAALTLTLPTAVGRTGRDFLIKKIGANPLTIATTSSQTIDGVLTEIISMTNGFREVVSDGANWRVRGGKVDPVIAALTDTANGGTLTINAAAATIYRGRLTGATATLAAPTNPMDGDVINLELYPTVACTLTIASAIVLTGGITSSIALPVGKLWSAALRYRAATSPATAAAAWRLLASSVDN